MNAEENFLEVKFIKLQERRSFHGKTERRS